jgi:hypothetical protein
VRVSADKFSQVPQHVRSGNPTAKRQSQKTVVTLNEERAGRNPRQAVRPLNTIAMPIHEFNHRKSRSPLHSSFGNRCPKTAGETNGQALIPQKIAAKRKERLEFNRYRLNF